MLRHQNMSLFFTTFAHLADTSQRLDPALARQLLLYLRGMAGIVLGSHHPLNMTTKLLLDDPTNKVGFSKVALHVLQGVSRECHEQRGCFPKFFPMFRHLYFPHFTLPFPWQMLSRHKNSCVVISVNASASSATTISSFAAQVKTWNSVAKMGKMYDKAAH